MAGKALRVIEDFWRIQDSGDYGRLIELFAEDARLEDPIWGVFEGRAAISGFLARMVEELGGRDIRFAADEIQGDAHVAWARWTMHSPKGRRSGVGIYRVEGGKLVFYRDYLDPPAKGG